MKENHAPVANMNCFITTGTTYQCNANAYDPDGALAESIWTIEGQSFSGASALYEFTNGGDKIISLKVTDNLGKSAVYSTTVHVDKPIIVGSCQEISPFKVRCDVSGSVDTENTGILNFRIYFDDEDMTVGSIGEYEFQTPGVKTIRIEMINGNNKKSVLAYSINIDPKYTPPKPVFFSEVEFNKVVSFDASDSLLQGRKVVSYEWTYGDGQKMVTNQPVAQHNYNENTYYNVFLKVTDETGAITTFTDQVYVYDPIVSDPGDAGKIDLLGIDSDSNGIRDDVQRWIQYEAKDNLEKKRYLEAIALIFEDNFRHLDQLTSILGNFSKKNKYEECLKLVETDSDKREELKNMFSVYYVNTNERAKAFLKIDNSFAGQVTEPEMDQNALSTFCQGVGK